MILDEVTREAWADYEAQDFDPNADYPGPDDPDPGDAARFVLIAETADGRGWGIKVPDDPWSLLQPSQPRHACVLCAQEIDLPDEDGYDLHTYHMRILGYPYRDQTGERVAE